ncbi:MAG: hypothetical protein AAFY98_05255 [Verrucomicrobiota bacterium]
MSDAPEPKGGFGCLMAIVAIIFLGFAFLMGILSTRQSYEDGSLTDPWGEEGPAQLFQLPDNESTSPPDE